MMDMVNSFSQMQQEQVAMQVQMNVLKKSLGMQQFVGEAVISLMESAAEPVGKSLHSGQNLDIYA